VSDLDTRLINCFTAAFPEIRPAQATSATVDNTQSWDSMGSLTLQALIEEEFAIRFDDDAIESLRSYALIRSALADSLSFVSAQESGS
jgi:acyl carrier protein